MLMQKRGESRETLCMIESAGDRPVRAVTALMSSCRVTNNIVSAKSPSDHSFLSARVFTDLHPCPEHRLAGFIHSSAESNINYSC